VAESEEVVGFIMYGVRGLVSSVDGMVIDEVGIGIECGISMLVVAVAVLVAPSIDGNRSSDVSCWGVEVEGLVFRW
jgi:hypothetical protein